MKPKPKPKKAAVKRPLHAPKKRMREATHRKPTKKVRPTMTNAETTQPRGAGSGENAVATRTRQYNEPASRDGGGKTYPKGDIAKGRLDPDRPDRLIAHRDRRAFLQDQAEKNEAANDELNAIQVEQNERAMEAFKELDPVLDPDKQRDESMENAVLALREHDPDVRKQQVDAKQKAADKRMERVEGRQEKRTNEGRDKVGA